MWGSPSVCYRDQQMEEIPLQQCVSILTVTFFMQKTLICKYLTRSDVDMDT